MATPRRPYVNIRLGVFEDALAAGVSDGATLLLARLLAHRDKRSIPGLLRFGPAGLSESLKRPLSRTQRDLAELERAGLVLIDRPERLIYVVGAIDIDGPRTENATRGMAAQSREMPPSSKVTRAVRQAIVAFLSNGDRTSAWLPIWNELAGLDLNLESSPDANPESGPEPGPLPRSEIRDPNPRSAAAADSVALFRRAWDRLPTPFAAAAADDFAQAAKTFDVQQFDQLVEALACSKWVTSEGGLVVVPTLRALIAKPEYAGRIARGEFVALGSRWRCPECETVHGPTADCPPVCACGRCHPPGHVCQRARDMEARVQIDAERTDPKSFSSLVATVGIRKAIARKAATG